MLVSWTSSSTDLQSGVLPNLSSNAVLYIVIGIFFVIMYYILIISFQLATIKSVKDSYDGQKINIAENVIYWFKNLFNSFKTYWYIFAYVALIPAILFIIGWIMVNLWFYEKLSDSTSIWIFFLVFWIVLFLFFSLYRWLKSTFALYSAVDKNSFSRENFVESVSITHHNWWRMIWNFILLSIITSIVLWVIWVLLSIFTFVSSSSTASTDENSQKYEKVMSNWNIDKQYVIALIIADELWDDVDKIYKDWNFDVNYIVNNLSKSSYFQVSFSDVFSSTINLFVSSLWEIYLFVFIYVFYRRLYFEKKWEEVIIIEKKDIVI
jgi:hypothetical protein